MTPELLLCFLLAQSPSPAQLRAAPHGEEQLAQLRATPHGGEQLAQLRAAPHGGEQLAQLPSPPYRAERLTQLPSPPYRAEQPTQLPSPPHRAEQLTQLPSPPHRGGEGQGEGADRSPSPEALLEASDRARGGLEHGVTWTVSVESTEEGTVTRSTHLVRARGVDALVEALSPPRRKGELMLFNDRNIWFVKPGLRRPIAISARQRMQGQAANGDIASTNYARDYAGNIVGDDVVGTEPAWRLELKARAKNVTYDKIRYWISKKRKLGLKAEFLTVGGDVFKTATFEYGNRVRIGAEDLQFVSRMTIRDAMGAGDVTVLDFRSPRAETHAPSVFNVNNVVR